MKYIINLSPQDAFLDFGSEQDFDFSLHRACDIVRELLMAFHNFSGIVLFFPFVRPIVMMVNMVGEQNIMKPTGHQVF
jgi:hypothetical protein